MPPSKLHEILIDMFRERPALAADLLSEALGLAVPPFDTARLSSAELNDVTPTEYRADAVVTLDAGGKAALGVVIEVQLKESARKRRSWPVYAATAYARLGCPVAVLTICPSPRVAGWAAQPILVGHPDFVLTPVVLGPQQVPKVTDVGLARRQPELAVLSVLAHGGRDDPSALFAAFAAALDEIDQAQAHMYYDLVMSELPAAAAASLEDFMAITNYEYQSDFARRNYAKGEANALLMVLDGRGIPVPDDVRAEIAACTDRARIEGWLRRAATASTIEDVLG